MAAANESKVDLAVRLALSKLGEPGAPAPSEANLQEWAGVSRITARAALAQLESDGWITPTTPGKRRTVRDRRRWHWAMTTWEAGQHHSADADAWAATVAEQGGEPSTEVSVSVVAADADIAAALEVSEGEAVVCRGRVRSINGEPHQLQASYFPKWLTDDAPIFLQPGDISAPGGLLAHSGHPQAVIHDEVTARTPTDEERQVLRMSPTETLLVVKRTGKNADGRPVRFMVTRCAATTACLSWELPA